MCRSSNVQSNIISSKQPQARRPWNPKHGAARCRCSATGRYTASYILEPRGKRMGDFRSETSHDGIEFAH